LPAEAGARVQHCLRGGFDGGAEFLHSPADDRVFTIHEARDQRMRQCFFVARHGFAVMAMWRQ
jgi:hypothetical protein